MDQKRRAYTGYADDVAIYLSPHNAVLCQELFLS